MSTQTTLGRLSVALEANTAAFEKSIKQAERRLEMMADKAKLAAEKAEEARQRQASFAAALKGTATEMNSVWSLAQRVLGTITDAMDAASEGAKNMAAQGAFEAAGKSLDKYREATHGLLADSDLIKKSNLAQSMGIQEKAFLSLANVAHTAALNTGQSFDYMFDSIILGTARSSRLLLDNLGIIVSQKEANHHYAEALKSGADAAKYQSYTVDQLANALSDEAKKRAFANEVMKKSEEAMGNTSTEASKLADEYTKMEADIKNAQDSVKSMAAVLMRTLVPALVKIAELIRDAARAWQEYFTIGTMNGTSDEELKQDALANRSHDISSRLQAAKAKRDTQIAIMQAGFATVPKELRNPENEANAIRVVFDSFKDEIERLTKELKGVGVEKGAKAADKPQVELKDPKGGGGRWRSEDWFKGDEGDWGFVGKWAKEEQEKQGAAFVQMLKTRKSAEDQHAAFVKSLGPEERRVYLTKGQAALEGFQRTLEEGANEAARRLEQQQVEREKIGIGSEKAKTVLDPLSQLLGGGGAGGFISLLSGQLSDSVGTAIGGALGGGIGALVGFLVDLLGPIIAGLKPVMNFLTALGQAIGSIIEIGLTPLLSALDPLSTSLRFFGVAVGTLIAAFLISSGGGLVSIVKVIIQALASLINGLSFVIFALSPILEALTSFAGFFEPLFEVLYNAVHTSAMRILDAAIALYNGLIEFVRHLGDDPKTKHNESLLKAFGDKISQKERLDLMARLFGAQDPGSKDDPVRDNTDATKENTATLRDLAREFKNLPSGYKIAGADFATSNPAPSSSPGGQINMEMGITGLSMSTFYRGRR